MRTRLWPMNIIESETVDRVLHSRWRRGGGGSEVESGAEMGVEAMGEVKSGE